MKKLTIFSLFLLLAGWVNVQGNLQFNQVKYIPLTVTQSGTSLYTDAITVITVPANKVWKIESVTSCVYNPSVNSLSFSLGGRVIIDNRLVFDANTNPVPIFPYWLPAGTYNIVHKSHSLNNGTTYYGALSAIEFNVVP